MVGVASTYLSGKVATPARAIFQTQIAQSRCGFTLLAKAKGCARTSPQEARNLC